MLKALWPILLPCLLAHTAALAAEPLKCAIVLVQPGEKNFKAWMQQQVKGPPTSQKEARADWQAGNIAYKANEAVKAGYDLVASIKAESVLPKSYQSKKIATELRQKKAKDESDKRKQQARDFTYKQISPLIRQLAPHLFPSELTDKSQDVWENLNMSNDIFQYSEEVWNVLTITSQSVKRRYPNTDVVLENIKHSLLSAVQIKLGRATPEQRAHFLEATVAALHTSTNSPERLEKFIFYVSRIEFSSEILLFEVLEIEKVVFKWQPEREQKRLREQVLQMFAENIPEIAKLTGPLSPAFQDYLVRNEEPSRSWISLLLQSDRSEPYSDDVNRALQQRLHDLVQNSSLPAGISIQAQSDLTYIVNYLMAFKIDIPDVVEQLKLAYSEGKIAAQIRDWIHEKLRILDPNGYP